MSTWTDFDGGALRGPDGQLLGKKAAAKAQARYARDALRAYLGATGVNYGGFKGALLVVCEDHGLAIRVVGQGCDPVPNVKLGSVAFTLWRSLLSLAKDACDAEDGIVLRAAMSDGTARGVAKGDLASFQATAKGGDAEDVACWLAAHGTPAATPAGLGGAAAFLAACVAALVEQGIERPPGIDDLVRGLGHLVTEGTAAVEAKPPKLHVVKDPLEDL